MKKFLSLVLALVMTMSLVTISAGAKDFTDADKVTYAEAIDVMSAVKVIDGYTDGSFKPQTQLNRGQAAKILCNMILGPTTAAALKADAAPFKDVAVDNTFAGYIAYCAKAGIIDGYTDGTFRPSAPLTGYAFMKLLLGALGYDKDVEGYNVPNWSINVAKQALGIGLDNGLTGDFDGTKIVTREEACLYAFNTLKATMVEYDAKTSVSVGGAEVVIAGSAAKEVKNEDPKDNTINKDGKMQFAEKYFSKLTRTTTSGSDAFGRPANEWKYKAEVVGNYADYSDLIATYTKKAKKGDLYDLVGGTIVKGLGGKYELTVYVDGAMVKDPAVADYFDKNSSKGAGVSGNGVLTEVFMDDDSNVTIVFVNTYLVKATADYNEKKETLNIETVEINDADGVTPSLPTSISNDDLNVESFKEGDYILVTVSLKGTRPSIESVQAAEVLTGKVSKYTVTDNVTIDGFEYSYNKLVGTSATESGVEYTIGENAKVVKDKYGYILFVDEAVSTSSYIFIEKTGSAVGVGSKTAANAFFTDGTNDAIILKKVNGNSDTGSLMGADGWYTYIKDSADKYILDSVKNPQSTNSKAFTGTSVAVMSNSKVDFMGTGVKANASTKFILWDAKNDVYVYDGIANAPTVKTGAVGADTIKVSWIEKKGYATYVFIDASKDADAFIEDVNNVADFLFILKSTGNKTVEGENVYYQYKVLFDGEETTKYIEKSIVGADAQGVLAYNIKANDKGYITSGTLVKDVNNAGKSTHQVTAMTIAGASTIDQSGKTLSVTGDYNRNYIVDNDTKITLVVGKGCELLKDNGATYELYQNLSANALGGIVKGYKLTGTVYAVVDDAKSETLDYLFVYVKNADDTEMVTVTVNGTKIPVAKGGTSFVYDVPPDMKLTSVTGGTFAPAEGTGKVTITMNTAITKDETIEVKLEPVPAEAEKVVLTLKGDLANAVVYYKDGNPVKGTKKTVEEFGVLKATEWTIEVPTTPVATFALTEGNSVDVVIKANGILFDVPLTEDTIFASSADVITTIADAPKTSVAVVKNGTALTVKFAKDEDKPSSDEALAAIVEYLDAEKIDKISADDKGVYTFTTTEGGKEVKYTFHPANDVTKGGVAAIIVDRDTVATIPTSSSKVTIKEVPAGTYLLKSTSNPGTYLVKVATKDGLTLDVVPADRELTTAYTVELPAGVTASYDKKVAAKNDKEVQYVGKLETITLTFGTAGTYKVNGVEETFAAGATKDVKIEGNLKVEVWETKAEFDKTLADAAKAIKDSEGATIETNKDGSVTVTVTDSSKSGTGVMDQMDSMLKKGYKITVTAPDGTVAEMVKDNKEGNKKAIIFLMPTVAGTQKTLTLTITGLAGDKFEQAVTIKAAAAAKP